LAVVRMQRCGNGLQRRIQPIKYFGKCHGICTLAARKKFLGITQKLVGHGLRIDAKTAIGDCLAHGLDAPDVKVATGACSCAVEHTHGGG